METDPHIRKPLSPYYAEKADAARQLNAKIRGKRAYDTRVRMEPFDRTRRTLGNTKPYAR